MVSALLHSAVLWKPQAIAGVARGGLIPATMAAATLALPLFMLRCDRAGGAVSWIGEPPHERRLLVVDDSCSTGETLRRVTMALHDQGYECLTMTVVHDPEVTSFTPDLSHAMTALFRLPWERGEATPTARALRASGANTERRVAEAPFLGLDLDGIFLPDLPRTDYAADLNATLQRRHGMASCHLLPEFELGTCGHHHRPPYRRPGDDGGMAGTVRTPNPAGRVPPTRRIRRCRQRCAIQSACGDALGLYAFHRKRGRAGDPHRLRGAASDRQLVVGGGGAVVCCGLCEVARTFAARRRSANTRVNSAPSRKICAE